MSTELIALVANLIFTLSLIVAVIFGIAQTRAAKRDRRERLTLETLRNFQSKEFAEMLHFTSTAVFPKTHEELSSWSRDNRERFLQLLQQMESLGILVADNLIDIDLVDKILGSFVNISWAKYKPVTIDARVKIPDPYLAEYFQWLAEQIERRMNENPRKPFYEP